MFTKNDRSNYVVRRKIGALLFERRLRKLPPVLFCDSSLKIEDDDQYTLMNYDELLEGWPANFGATLERCFMNICRLSPSPGYEVVFIPPRHNQFLFFTTDEKELLYYLKALHLDGLIDFEQPYLGVINYRLNLTPNGWLRFDEIERTSGSRNNPAFVAMAFGKDKKRSELNILFEEVIKFACQRVGWRAERSDSPEYNDSVIDKILSMIHAAPFVIADLSDNNLGAYYEAGFAHGLKKAVILLVKEGVKPHFDLSGFNQIRWKDHADLKVKLEWRIENTIGKGPHEFNNDPDLEGVS